VPTTIGRSRRRQGVHAGAQGAAGEHSPKIMGALSASLVVIVLVLTFTKIGHDIDAATQRFMLYYAGVFALIGLTGSVLLGLVATDRIVMTPGHRVMAQAVHRAFSFGTLAFLIIHIVTEILAQRSHVIDGVIPFLSPFRTFYIGLGTIASDLILLLVVTSIIRKRFTSHGKAWRWRAIHYASYVAFVFGVLHGLLGGRAAKPYVDWSYGFAIAVTALGLAVRFLATSLRPRETLSAPPAADRPAASGTSPMRAAALSMAQAQFGGTVQVLPASMATRTSVGMPGTDSWAAVRAAPALPAAPGWSSPASTGPIPALSAPVPAVSGPIPMVPGPAPTVSGPFQAIGAAPATSAAPTAQARSAASPSGAHRQLGFTPLGAPPYGDDVPADLRDRPRGSGRPGSGVARAGSAGAGGAARQPRYEPGYDGPPRFEGAPRRDVPNKDDVSSYPYGSPGGRPQVSRAGTGPIPRVDTGPIPRAETGPIPRVDTGPVPRAGTGPMPRTGTGPMPRAGTGPMPRTGTGPMPRADTGPMPRAGTGPMPRAGTGPAPRTGTEPGRPMRRADSGPMPRLDQVSRAETGPIPRVGAEPGSPIPRAGTGPRSQAPRPGTERRSAMPRAGTGPMPRAGTGPTPRAGTEPRSTMPRADTGPMPRTGSGSWPATGATRPADSPPGAHTGRGRRGTGRPSRGAGSTDARRRREPGPTRGDE
jgi:DMSO/TMAO reductase YedYZ heme-binding membrane subunit